MPKGKSDKQIVKILIIRDYLLSHTNENHFVTSKELIDHLDKEWGIRADRKTIFSDIARLETEGAQRMTRNTRKGPLLPKGLLKSKHKKCPKILFFFNHPNYIHRMN